MQNKIKQHGVSSAVYGLGFIGAAVYFITTAPTFWLGAFGILKAFAWPALLVYHYFNLFGM